MPRAKKRSRRDEGELASDETSENAPKSPRLPKAKDRRTTSGGHRFSPMNAAYGDSVVPDFPIPD
jgi:hypothetical protein